MGGTSPRYRCHARWVLLAAMVRAACLLPTCVVLPAIKKRGFKLLRPPPRSRRPECLFYPRVVGDATIVSLTAPSVPPPPRPIPVPPASAAAEPDYEQTLQQLATVGSTLSGGEVPTLQRIGGDIGVASGARNIAAHVSSLVGRRRLTWLS